MPTYVYECRQCEKVFEIEQRITEDALTDCDCGQAGALRRLIQPTAVMFKGGGFYVNDANRPNPASGAKTAGGASDEAAGASCDGTGACPSCTTD